jgi:ABC-2 type transport system permease protein
LPAHPLPALAARAALRPTLGWAIGLAVYFLLIGVLARSMTEFLQDNPRFADLAAQAGFAELGSVEGYVAALFGLLAVPLGAFAASRMAAVAADEDAGRLTLLYSRPVSRLRWVAVEALVGVVAIIVLAGVVALATWAGAAAAGAGLRPGAALAGALNVLPIALLCLGAALLALGWAPEAVLPLGVLPAAGGYLLLVLSDSFGWPALVRGASPFAHLAGVPAQPWDGAGALGTLVAAVVLGGVGVVGYRRRDLRG